MAFTLVLLLVSLPLLNAEAAATTQENPKTLDDIFIESFDTTVNGYTGHTLEAYNDFWRLKENPNERIVLPFTKELYEYLGAVERWILAEYARVLAAVPVQSIYDDLNEHCSQYEETAIEDLAQKPRNTTCVRIRLGKLLTSEFKMAVEAGLLQLARECIRKEISFCSVASRNCTEAHEERIRRILTSSFEDAINLYVENRKTKLNIIFCLADLFTRTLQLLFQIYSNVGGVFNYPLYLKISSLSATPFDVENVVRPWVNNAISETLVSTEKNTLSEDKLTWGIIRSNTGKVDLQCSTIKENDPRSTDQYFRLLYDCFYVNLLHSNSELMVCAYTDTKSTPLTWLTVPPVHFHSQCLCLAYEGKACKVKAPQGVDPRFYCLSVLLSDFRRQVSYRPAITYLDYAFKTRVPLCKFSKFLPSAFRIDCKNTSDTRYVSTIQSVQCYFKGLVNKQLNCSEALVVDTFNHTQLCYMMRFIRLVLCDDEDDDDVRVLYYGAGDSTLVLLLTYVDVAVRVWTLVTYLLCSELRNLPGKLLICYQGTALLRLLVVRAGLEDLQIAVRVDVAMDLASTLWLTSYLHFLTASIKALRLPDSLRPDEVRMVLLRYALLGWALPAALSAGFFRLDEVVDSRIQFGQVLFLLCNYTALLGNLYMFYHNLSFYYDVKTSAILLQRGGKVRSVFTLMFKFALKTSVLSGAGIVFRLVFTQIQGLEHVLGYYHALGTLQGLLLFLLYGCNRDARVFWIRVFQSTLSHCQRRHNTPDQ